MFERVTARKIGGQLIRNEPIVHDVILQEDVCLEKFQNYGWLDYLKLQSFIEDIATEFAQTFSNGKAMVKGLEVVVTEERIAEIIGLSIDGEPYPTSRDARTVRVKFIEPGDPPLVVDKQGARRTLLLDKWMHAVMHICKYITCEGHQYCLHSIHFKLLNHLRHGRRINVPNVLYKLLEIMAT